MLCREPQRDTQACPPAHPLPPPHTHPLQRPRPTCLTRLDCPAAEEMVVCSEPAGRLGVALPRARACVADGAAGLGADAVPVGGLLAA